MLCALHAHSVDPLAVHRNLLRSGLSVKHYINGKGTIKHIFISNEWSAIVVRETVSAKSVTRGNRIQLRSVRGVVRAFGVGHEGRGIMGKRREAGDESLCFVIDIAGSEAFCGECNSTRDRERWCDALDALVRVSRRAPHKVRPP